MPRKLAMWKKEFAQISEHDRKNLGITAENFKKEFHNELRKIRRERKRRKR